MAFNGDHVIIHVWQNMIKVSHRNLTSKQFLFVGVSLLQKIFKLI